MTNDIKFLGPIATKMDWDLVELRTRQIQKSHSIPTLSQAFSRLALSTILDISDEDARDCLTDGGNDRGIDAVYINESRKTIYLFQFKHCEKYEKSHKYFPSDVIDKIAAVFKYIGQSVEGERSHLNPLLYKKIEAMRACVEDELYQFVIVLCSNTAALPNTELDRLKALVGEYQFVETQSIHCLELARLLSIPRATSVTKTVKYVPSQILERSDGNKRGLVCTIRATDLIEFLKCPVQKNRIDDNLFQQNVRLFLGTQNSVNRGIRQTLASKSASDFWYLNNGITIVCERFEYQPKMASPIRILNPQIVNGCQTAHELFDFGNGALDSIEDVTVGVRIVETTDAKLAGKIAEATNSQSSIRGRDLRANDEVQIRLEAGFKELGFLYERKKNQHSGKSIDKRIDALRAGQAMMAYHLGKPDKAKSATDQIFDGFYSEVFDPKKYSTEDYLAAVQLLNLVDTRKELAKKELGSTTRHFYQEDWIIEGNFHVLFALRLIADKRGISLKSVEQIATLIDEAVKEISDYVRSKRNAAAYRLFRSAVTTEQLRSQLATHQPTQLRLELLDTAFNQLSA